MFISKCKSIPVRRFGTMVLNNHSGANNLNNIMGCKQLQGLKSLNRPVPLQQAVTGVQSKALSYLARHHNRSLTPFANRLFANDFWSDFDLNLPRSPSAWMRPELDRVGRVGGFSLGAVDVHEDDNGWVLAVDTPGMTIEDVKVQSHQNVITISGERKTEKKDEETGHFERSFGKFSRSFQLGENANIKDVSATLDNGVLRIAIPKLESLPKAPEAQDIPITLAPPKQEQLTETAADKKKSK